MLKIVVTAALLAAAAPALAEDRPQSFRVDTADLDLTTPAGIRILDRRLTAAIKQACPGDEDVRDLSQRHEIALCRAEKRAEIAPRRDAMLAAAQTRKSRLAAAN